MRLKNYFMCFAATVMLSMSGLSAWAQTVSVSGKVTESDGKTPVVGCVVAVKGTSTGVTTGNNGDFKLNAKKTDLLVFQSLGYETMEVEVGNRTIINVVMKSVAQKIDDVVVTALGLTREQKSLGYAVSKVDNADLTQAVAGNWLNGLQGKVAGLTFNGAGSGPIGSMRVTLRGDNSLSYGGNDALFVVDGIPVLSGTIATSSSSSYTNSGADFPVDFGNGASDINPDDIESISVLKGPAATALYGSRASNGAIVITTKSGRTDKGVGVTYSGSVSIEQAGFWPDFQTQYGSGADLGLNEYCFWTLDNSLVDGKYPDRNLSRYAWGEKFAADKMRYQYAGKNWQTGEIVKTPFIYQDDWFSGLFQTGVTYSNSLTVEGSNGKGNNVRFSITDSRNKWILPNTGYAKQSLSFTLNQPVNKWIKFNTKINYYRTDSDNMPMAGYHQTTVMYDLMWGYNSNSMSDWRNEYFEGRFNETNRNADISQNGNSLVFAGTGSYNPYRVLYEELNSVDRDRVVGSAGFTINLAKGLTLDVKTGVDMNHEFQTQRKPKLTTGWENGMYREKTFTIMEMNSDFMFKYQNSFLDDRLSLTAAFGGNNMSYNYFRNTLQLSELDIDGVYHLNNIPEGIITDVAPYRSRKVINSLYGLASLGWADTYFLDITGRNDWSSTLSRGNWSYFYPSVAASILFDKVFNFRENAPWITFTKMRLSWANVGGDTGPYSLDQYYGNSSIAGGHTLPGTITNPNIKPTNTEAWELGLEAKFLQNRIGFDVTLYTSDCTNQILDVDIDQITGASGMKINAGNINNKGIEVSLNFVPVQTRDFRWDVNVNWAKNKNTLVALQDGWDPAKPYEVDMGTTVGGRLHCYSYIGQEMYQLYGIAPVRAAEGSYYLDKDGNKVDCSGQLILNAKTGMPSLTSGSDNYLGKVNPDYRGGISTSFSYKNLALSATFSYQKGGNRFSVTNGILDYQGKLSTTLEGRYDGIVAQGVNIVQKNEDGTTLCQVNNTITENIYTYYQAVMNNRYNGEAQTFDTSFFKMKEARLEYRFPKAWSQKSGFLQGGSIALFATNLFCISNWPQFDPEAGMMTGTNVFNGIEAGTYPMTRTYGLNIKLSF